MKKIRACLGSNEGITIADTHLGDTEKFYIYDIYEEDDARFIDKRINVAIEMEHAREDKMKKILDIIEDVQILVSARKSPNFKKIAAETKFQPVIVWENDIKKVLSLLKKNFSDIYEYVEKRKEGNFTEIIPELD